MPDYLSSSACRGRRPNRLAADRGKSRSDLVARMLREREVARFLVAPGGFGKTRLAAEYADVVFSFEHTFWFDARSPCFLRDLDGGSFAEGVAAKDADARLVVFDDVPPLDDVRADALSREIDALLEHGTEVVVALSPAADAYARRQPDRVALFPADLLLTDEEIAEAREGGFDGRGIEAAERVPVVAWGGPDGLGLLLDALAGEGLPSTELAVAFRMLVLVSGDLADAALPATPAAAVRTGAAAFADTHPYFGIDAGLERFAAPEVGIERVCGAFSPRFSAIADAAGASGADAMLAEIADELVARGRPDRACRLMLFAAARPVRETWLAEHDRALLDRCCLEPACALYASARPAREGGEGWLCACEAVRLLALGDRVGAFELGLSLGRAAAASGEARALSLLVALAAASDEGERAEAARELSRTALPRASLVEDAPLVRPAAHPWRAAATVVSALSEGVGAACESLRLACGRGVDRDALAAAATGVALFASKAEPSAVDGADPAFAHMLEFLASYVDDRVAASGRAGLLTLGAEHALSAALPLAPAVRSASVGSAAAQAVRAAASSVAEQRARWRRSRERPGEALAGPTLPGRRARRRRRPGTPVPPTLSVELFGGVFVSIGVDPVDEGALGRRKLKTLLALLTLDAGREIPRDRLAEALWPDRPIDAARKNIYSLWSQLKRALALPDGTCPYLVRMPNGYKLEDAWLESDVRRVDELCRVLLFGRADPDGWVEILGELGSFGLGGFMPCETDNDAIAEKRREYHTRIVDALVGASRRLVEAGDAEAALWFARGAYELDRLREDVYCALMRAQIASGQRAAALTTYFECRRFLADGLGIDPSAELVGLYRGIIEEEAPVDW